jgi:hypothetical protein
MTETELGPAIRSVHRRATLVHEGGHAVVHMALGNRFDHVIILGDKSGRVNANEAEWDANEPGKERDYAVGIAAGLIAELLWLRAARHTELEGLARDGAEWDAHLLRYYARRGGFGINAAKAEAHDKVIKNWSAILRTAAVLHRAKTMGYGRVRSVAGAVR